MPKINYDHIEKKMADHPDDWFSPEESDRRMKEAMRRMFHNGATMNMTTGQNLKEPFLSESELKQRGYPCECGFE